MAVSHSEITVRVEGLEEVKATLVAAVTQGRAMGYRQGRLDAAKEIAAEADIKNLAASTPYEQGVANGMLRAANLIYMQSMGPGTPAIDPTPADTGDNTSHGG